MNATAGNQEGNCHLEQPVPSTQHFGRGPSAIRNGPQGKAGSGFWKGRFEPFLLNIRINITIRSHLYHKLSLILLPDFQMGWIQTESSEFRLTDPAIILFSEQGLEALSPSSCEESGWQRSPSQDLPVGGTEPISAL